MRASTFTFPLLVIITLLGCQKDDSLNSNSVPDLEILNFSKIYNSNTNNFPTPETATLVNDSILYIVTRSEDTRTLLKVNLNGDVNWSKDTLFPPNRFVTSLFENHDGQLVLKSTAYTDHSVPFHSSNYTATTSIFRTNQAFQTINAASLENTNNYYAAYSSDILELGNEYVSVVSLNETNDPNSQNIHTYKTLIEWFTRDLIRQNKVEIGIDSSFTFNTILKSRNGFLLTGEYRGKAYAREIDDNGNTIWSNQYDNLKYTSKAIHATDNGFYIAGITTDHTLQENDLKLIKVDELGNQEWSKTYGITHPNRTKLILTNNNELVMVGGRRDQQLSDDDIFVIRTDFNGNVLNEYTFGKDGIIEAPVEIIESGRAYFVVGYSDYQLYIIKIEK